MPKRSGASSTTAAASTKKQKKAAPATVAAGKAGGTKPLSQWRVVMTGDFVVKPKAALEHALKEKGVAITSAISGKTTHLLLGNKSEVNEYGKKTGVGSSKHSEAVERELPILSEEQVWSRLGVAVEAVKPVTKKSILDIATKPAKKASLVEKVLFAFQEADGAGTDTLVREPVEHYFPISLPDQVGVTLVAQGGAVYIQEISPSSIFANQQGVQPGMRVKRIDYQVVRGLDHANRLLQQEPGSISVLPTIKKMTFVVSLPKLKKELIEQFDLKFDNTRSKNALKKALTTLVDEKRKLVKQSGTSHALVVETETRPPLALTSQEQEVTRQAKIQKLYPEQGRWKGLRVVNRMKSKTGRATCKACGQIIGKGEVQSQVADSSLLKMLGNDYDRPYTEEDFGLGRTIAVTKFYVHETCLDAADTQFRDIFQQ